MDREDSEIDISRPDPHPAPVAMSSSGFLYIGRFYAYRSPRFSRVHDSPGQPIYTVLRSHLLEILLQRSDRGLQHTIA